MMEERLGPGAGSHRRRAAKLEVVDDAEQRAGWLMLQ